VGTRLGLIAATCVALIGASAGGVDAQTAAPEARFALRGIAFVGDGAGRAWLQEPHLTQNHVVSVRAGEDIGPYRLSKVLEDRVELEGPTGALVVFMAGAAGIPDGMNQASASRIEIPPSGLAGDDMPVFSPDDPRRQFAFGSIFGVQTPFAPR